MSKGKKQNWRWYFRMAWRDSRRSRSRLLLFVSAIVLGVAALVAIDSFRNNLETEIDEEAQALLGADLEVESHSPIREDTLEVLDTLQARRSHGKQFFSMVSFADKGTRLVNIKALEKGYPFYGSIETMPVDAADKFLDQQGALVSGTLLTQYGVSVGDSVKVGQLSFEIVGKLLKMPGQTDFSNAMAAPVCIPLQYLEQTGLIQKGSRVEHKIHYQFTGVGNKEKRAEKVHKALDKLNIDHETVATQKEDTGEAFSRLTGFLNLVGFIALILGSIGVASSVHIYIREKLSIVAMLRCIGLKGKQAFMIFLLQVMGVGLIGALTGAVLGSIFQLWLPDLLRGFLPFTMETRLAWSSVLFGVGTGLIMSFLFALSPLLAVRNASPLQAIGSFHEERSLARDRYQWVVAGAALLFILAFAWWQLEGILGGLIFTGSVVLVLGVLAGTARGIMYLVRRFFPAFWPYVWRQGLANLYRPNNQTLVLVVAIGLGTALIATLFFSQQLLLRQTEVTGAGNEPNMILFDIQPEQLEPTLEYTRKKNMPIKQQVPIVTMRLERVKGRPVGEVRSDTTLDISGWVLDHEYRATYRDSLIDTEKLVGGEWVERVPDGADTIPISLEADVASDMKVEVGDPLTFNVQGALLNAKVASLRKIQWRKVQTNFLVVFPANVLEQAPKTHVIVTRIDSTQDKGVFQQELVRMFPNISVIDLGLILDTLNTVLDKISFVIRFMGMFSMLTGVLILIGSVILSKYQRIQESVLLRTLGAVRRQILAINAIEYFFLGSIAALAGVLFALMATWGLAIFQFGAVFRPGLLSILGLYGTVTLLTMLIGMANVRSVLNEPPLQILRKGG